MGTFKGLRPSLASYLALASTSPLNNNNNRVKSISYCSIPYAYFVPYAYGTYHTRTVRFSVPYAYGIDIRVWYVPYAYYQELIIREEFLTPYSPVIDDCAEVKQLLFRVTYRLASIFSHLTTKAIPDTRACVQLDVPVHHEEHRSVA